MRALLLDIRTRRLEQLQTLRETLEQRRGGAAAVRLIAAAQPGEQRLGQRQCVGDPIAVLDSIEDREALDEVQKVSRLVNSSSRRWALRQAGPRTRAASASTRAVSASVSIASVADPPCGSAPTPARAGGRSGSTNSTDRPSPSRWTNRNWSPCGTS